MTYRLTATITHKTFDSPVIKEIFFYGKDLDDVLAQIETLPQHKKNLKHHRKAGFIDARGVKHRWVLEEVDDIGLI